jgi:hypothetical protein
MVDRIILVTRAAKEVPRAVQGNIRAFGPSLCKDPPAGRIFNQAAKRTISNKPNQKTGIDAPRMANTLLT